MDMDMDMDHGWEWEWDVINFASFCLQWKSQTKRKSKIMK